VIDRATVYEHDAVIVLDASLIGQVDVEIGLVPDGPIIANPDSHALRRLKLKLG
jgi:hypothetical protein